MIQQKDEVDAGLVQTHFVLPVSGELASRNGLPIFKRAQRGSVVTIAIVNALRDDHELPLSSRDINKKYGQDSD
jgi:hypothetical protein